MSKSTQALASREQGQFPISKGTSYAIESLVNMHPDREKIKPEPLSQIDVLLVNIRTLYRNMLGGLKAAVKEQVQALDIPDFLFQEMQQVRAAVDKIGHGRVQVFFYLCTYPDLKKHFPKANLIEPTTLKQKAAKEMEDQVIAAMVASPQLYGYPKIFEYTVEGGKLENERVALLTHLPLDLVNRYQFKEMYLLESNTGAFKRPSEFNSKFKVKPEGTHLPFSTFTLQIFGDGGKMFMPMASEITNSVAEIARKNRWTPLTTAEKIRYNLDNSQGNKFSGFLKALLRE